MWLRVTAREFSANGDDGNRRALRAVVDDGRVPGLIGYRDGEPAGWVSVAPREDFGRLDRSPITKSVDDTPVWSVVCFFIAKDHRRSGLAGALLDAAVAYAAERGAEVVEGYPLDPTERRIADADAWHGTLAMFTAAGFTPVVTRRPGRPIVRRVVRATD
ncbi:MAG: GNAT family N-acetyltransferase [Chloroflexi bacterium]|nr:GNAT family N-acetyltransferase [Chloroflexota bacterium]